MIDYQSLFVWSGGAYRTELYARLVVKLSGQLREPSLRFAVEEYDRVMVAGVEVRCRQSVVSLPLRSRRQRL